MNHQELEEQYSPSRWSKRYSAQEIINVHVRVVKDLSQAARETVSHRIDVPYGPGPRAKLDVYGEDLPPVSMECIVEEIRAAVVWSCQLARQRGSHCVVLAGWSAGGHLVTQALMPGSGQELPDNTDTSLYKDIIRGVVTVSGVFDLRPLVNTYVNAPLHLTERSAWKLSPLASVKELGRAWSPLSILVTVGQHDSPEFKRQSEEFCQECVKAGLKAEYLEVELADHFSITEDLSKEDFSLTQRLISFLKTCDHMHKTKLPTKA
nr:kynurenine formamidase-like isoform X2 [Cherax quadricarinatus]